MIVTSRQISKVLNVRKMKVLQQIIFAAYLALITNARLIKKNTEKPAETQPTESLAAVRVSRRAYYEDSVGISKEDNTQEEDLRTYVRKGRYSIKTKSNTKNTKVPKDSYEEVVTNKQTETIEAPSKTTKTLIKKPIPKFNEVDDEDFQGKVNKSPMKFADSGEHEDEDFNLDDYEFDVNHDEFVGRGKPLEPRMKDKDAREKKNKKSYKLQTTLPPPEIKIQSKVVIPTGPPVNAKKSSITKKVADKMKEDYYDDIVTTIKSPEKETKRDTDDDFSDDNEESKEINRKSSTRIARSPWFVRLLGDRMGEKTAEVMSKILNALPILPPGSEEYDILDTQSVSGVSNPSEIAKDPLTGRRFIF